MEDDEGLTHPCPRVIQKESNKRLPSMIHNLSVLRREPCKSYAGGDFLAQPSLALLFFCFLREVWQSGRNL
ncbi:hypothetical protein E2C01_004791 [Portunus trituberculatus]|uniref:Uncharacterized protein n=1 Tax=Portunus trituberculatus TaxID=210409 RepID=A0A5B7CXD5_PORTR|nr:hypothetical protein [Portunus trituberculatus]